MSLVSFIMLAIPLRNACLPVMLLISSTAFKVLSAAEPSSNFITIKVEFSVYKRSFISLGNISFGTDKSKKSSIHKTSFTPSTVVNFSLSFDTSLSFMFSIINIASEPQSKLSFKISSACVVDRSLGK